MNNPYDQLVEAAIKAALDSLPKGASPDDAERVVQEKLEALAKEGYVIPGSIRVSANKIGTNSGRNFVSDSSQGSDAATSSIGALTADALNRLRERYATPHDFHTAMYDLLSLRDWRSIIAGADNDVELAALMYEVVDQATGLNDPGWNYTAEQLDPIYLSLLFTFALGYQTAIARYGHSGSEPKKE